MTKQGLSDAELAELNRFLEPEKPSSTSRNLVKKLLTEYKRLRSVEDDAIRMANWAWSGVYAMAIPEELKPVIKRNKKEDEDD